MKNWIKQISAKLFKSKYKDDDANRDRYFNALSDLLYKTIREQEEEDIALRINSYFYRKFHSYRREYFNKPIPYSADHYRMVYRLAEELAQIKTQEYSFLNEAVFGAGWFIGDDGEFPIQEETYRSIWNILVLALEYDREYLFMRFWIRSTQYMMYNLRPIYPDHTLEGGEFKINNQDLVNKRANQRDRFLEFTQALGGLVFYKQKYGLIKKMFTYTNSEPPKYELLPETMNEIFSAYFKFRDPYNLNFSFLLAKYYFPDIHGLGSERIIKSWICKYLALLFLRQYTLFKRLITDDFLGYPDIPKDQSEKRIWIDNLDYFFNQVEEVRSNEQLMEILGFDHMTDDWFKNNEKPSPNTFFKNFKQKIEEEFENEELNQELSDTKRKLFYDSSAEILTNTINEIKPITNPLDIAPTVDLKTWFMRNLTSVLPRKSFLDNVDSASLNAHSIVAEQQARHIKHFVVESFHLNRGNSYLLKNETLFKAIDKIKGDHDSNSLVIINTGIYLDYLINQLQIEGLSKNDYKGIPILLNLNYFSQFPGRSMYLLRKNDLPYLKFREPNSEEKKKYYLEPIVHEGHSEYKLYASIIDLNTKDADELREELKSEYKDLKNSVFIYIHSGLELHWNKLATVIELRQFSEFQEKGIPDSLEDIDIIL